MKFVVKENEDMQQLYVPILLEYIIYSHSIYIYIIIIDMFVMTIYAFILFFILTPGVLVRIPPKGSLMMVAFVHAIVFALIFHFSHKIVLKMFSGENKEHERQDHEARERKMV
jgi:hypothetical protein